MNTVHIQIQELISRGKTILAIQMLEKYTNDVVLLEARYNGAERQYSMGMIDFSEWSRTQAQINYAVLELASNYFSRQTVVVAQVVLQYFNFERQPGNDLGLVNKIFRTLHDMQEDLECPIGDLNKAVGMLHEIFGLPELVAKAEAFTLSAYTQNTEAYKLKERQKLVAEILKAESEFKATIKEIVEEEQKKTGWKEGFRLLKEEPSKLRWENVANLISTRLTDAIFEEDQGVKWESLRIEISEIPDGLLWRRKFLSKLPDIERFLTKNVH